MENLKNIFYVCSIFFVVLNEFFLYYPLGLVDYVNINLKQ